MYYNKILPPKHKKLPVYEKEFILYNYVVGYERGETYMIKTREINEIRNETDAIICDACGKEIRKNKFGEFDDFYHIEKTWGYHSDKDGRHDSFDICEECYDRMLEAIGLK